jgi:hypothetical protein
MSLFRPGEIPILGKLFSYFIGKLHSQDSMEKILGNSVPYLIPVRVFNQNIIFECIQLRGTMV